jgi:hypothetical protein
MQSVRIDRGTIAPIRRVRKQIVPHDRDLSRRTAGLSDGGTVALVTRVIENRRHFGGIAGGDEGSASIYSETVPKREDS